MLFKCCYTLVHFCYGISYRLTFSTSNLSLTKFVKKPASVYASIVGSVVECSPATRAARVRFPDDADSFLAPLKKIIHIYILGLFYMNFLSHCLAVIFEMAQLNYYYVDFFKFREYLSIGHSK